VRGSKTVTPVTSNDFRCRITLPKGSETHEEGRHKRRTQPTLLVGKYDKKGKIVSIKAGDDVEVVSNQHGTVRYQVAGDPEPLRKRRSIIGWQCAITKVES
jgi:hypothetical protein